MGSHAHLGVTDASQETPPHHEQTTEGGAEAAQPNEAPAAEPADGPLHEEGPEAGAKDDAPPEALTSCFYRLDVIASATGGIGAAVDAALRGLPAGHESMGVHYIDAWHAVITVCDFPKEQGRRDERALPPPLPPLKLGWAITAENLGTLGLFERLCDLPAEKRGNVGFALRQLGAALMASEEREVRAGLRGLVIDFLQAALVGVFR